MVEAAGGAPAVTTRIPFGARRRSSSGAFANEIKTVGAAQSMVTCSRRHQFEDSARLDFAQTDVRRARGGHGPDESPAVGVKHRQRPEITIGTGHRLMEQRADGIHPGIAVSDHHALRTRSRAAGVIDREQIGLANFRTDKFRRARVEQCFIVQPVLSFSRRERRSVQPLEAGSECCRLLQDNRGLRKPCARRYD